MKTWNLFQKHSIIIAEIKVEFQTVFEIIYLQISMYGKVTKI